ncbi:esterase/lipase family protein [Corynebacterium heidelbergense]|uniref:Triacylglycerol lipase n=1 Tax=Corynebacterium heidelbergense TaxID=2055947 RepID=A0A364V931_9CORY|nr:alpha/beta fold hydrolase [Corynebacterium heidelbergense]RAV33076.1 triacylglycerol lipase [Corynebacterium heidelbergense]
MTQNPSDATDSTKSGEQVGTNLGFLPAFLLSLAKPTLKPKGVNDFSPVAEGQVPVVLIHGTWLNAFNTWSYLAPQLEHAGYRVFAFNYGRDTYSLTGKPKAVYGTASILESQKEVAAFIEEVLERTGARQVDLIGHSQGVAQARLYLTDSGGANPEHPEQNKVRKLVGISGCNHGTTLSGVASFGKFLDRTGILDNPIRRVLGYSALDQRLGSDTVAHLNRHGDTVPGVDYTMICSRYDQIVTPWRTQRLEAGPGATVRNLLVQTGNVKDFSDHMAVLYSPKVLDLVLEALEGEESYRPGHPHVTGTVVPFLGSMPKVPWRQVLRRK